MSSDDAISASIDPCGVLRLHGKFPDSGIHRAALDELVMPLVTLGTRYACTINDGPKFHATPRMIGEQFVFCAEGDFWDARAIATKANAAGKNV